MRKGVFLLATVNDDLCLMTWPRAEREAQKLADEIKTKVWIRNALTNRIAKTVTPSRS